MIYVSKTVSKYSIIFVKCLQIPFQISYPRKLSFSVKFLMIYARNCNNVLYLNSSINFPALNAYLWMFLKRFVKIKAASQSTIIYSTKFEVETKKSIYILIQHYFISNSRRGGVFHFVQILTLLLFHRIIRIVLITHANGKSFQER